MSKEILRWYRKKQLAERYSTTTRTVDRWVDAGKFPVPDGRLPNGAPLWANTTIENHERNCVANATAVAERESIERETERAAS